MSPVLYVDCPVPPDVAASVAERPPAVPVILLSVKATVLRAAVPSVMNRFVPFHSTAPAAGVVRLVPDVK